MSGSRRSSRTVEDRLAALETRYTEVRAKIDSIEERMLLFQEDVNLIKQQLSRVMILLEDLQKKKS
jgi:uncharacterized coiled-coil protein SlyX